MLVKKNKHTCRWKVTFTDMIYDGGGTDSWKQYYFTWIGAQFSRWTHYHLRSWGGQTKLERVG